MNYLSLSEGEREEKINKKGQRFCRKLKYSWWRGSDFDNWVGRGKKEFVNPSISKPQNVLLPILFVSLFVRQLMR